VSRRATNKTPPARVATPTWPHAARLLYHIIHDIAHRCFCTGKPDGWHTYAPPRVPVGVAGPGAVTLIVWSYVLVIQMLPFSVFSLRSPLHKCGSHTTLAYSIPDQNRDSTWWSQFSYLLWMWCSLYVDPQVMSCDRITPRYFSWSTDLSKTPHNS